MHQYHLLQLPQYRLQLQLCNNTYDLLPNVDIDGNEGVNYEGKNDFNKCCNATQESHDGFYK